MSQEEGGELDSHEEVRLSFAGPGEIKRRDVVLDPQLSPDKEIKSREVELGPESWTSFASVVFQQQCYGHCFHFVTLLRTTVETAIA